jgi:hypothetical protein
VSAETAGKLGSGKAEKQNNVEDRIQKIGDSRKAGKLGGRNAWRLGNKKEYYLSPASLESTELESTESSGFSARILLSGENPGEGSAVSGGKHLIPAIFSLIALRDSLFTLALPSCEAGGQR